MVKYFSYGLIGLAGAVIAVVATALALLGVFVGVRALLLRFRDARLARLGYADFLPVAARPTQTAKPAPAPEPESEPDPELTSAPEPNPEPEPEPEPAPEHETEPTTPDPEPEPTLDEPPAAASEPALSPIPDLVAAARPQRVDA